MKTPEILEALSALKGVSFVGITMETVVPLTGGKKNPMKGEVTKVSEVQAMVAKTAEDVSVYENAVNKRLAAEGKDANFETGSLPWGTWKDDYFGLIIEHKGTDYIRLAILNTVTKPVFFLDGHPIAKDDIIGFPKSKSEGKQGGLSDDNKMFIRSAKVESIKAIRAFGTETVA